MIPTPQLALSFLSRVSDLPYPQAIHEIIKRSISRIMNFNLAVNARSVKRLGVYPRIRVRPLRLISIYPLFSHFCQGNKSLGIHQVMYWNFVLGTCNYNVPSRPIWSNKLFPESISAGSISKYDPIKWTNAYLPTKRTTVIPDHTHFFSAFFFAIGSNKVHRFP